MNKACVILGAGASFDVRNEGSPILNGDFRPPLARDLFNIREHSAYWDILQPYQGAQVLAQLLEPVISSGEASLEDALMQYADHPNAQMREHFKHVPAYLRDLLWKTSNAYTYMPSCYIQLVVQLLAEHPHEVLFLVLNYDDLLEKALHSFQSTFTFTKIGDYVAAGRTAKVVKLHGSIDWFKPLPIDPRSSWVDMVREIDVFEKPEEHQIIINPRVDQVIHSNVGDGKGYPLLTVPLAGKSPADVVCPSSHLQTAREFLRTCTKFLIIGTSALDQHLIMLLNDSVPPDIRPFLQVVDVGDGVEDTLARFGQGVRAFREGLANSWEITFNDGFRRYVSSSRMRAFARYQATG